MGLAMYNDPYSDPKAWESYFKNIVWLHYKPANCCDVFQCYLPEQSSDIDKLYKAQQKKIYTDIKKFSQDNIKELEELFGTLKISRWILATPYNKSAKLSQ